ncbi:MAG: T9SS type A sorting domain-containing protein [Bacteroidetes bacterium]|nr:T9SS type A sorting domain-containing protein [Bacteroidota bacterium]
MNRLLAFVIFACVSSVMVASAVAQPTSFESRGPGGGGALFSPSFNPTNPDELYLACDMTELFHSTDRGATWSIPDFRSIQSQKMAMVQWSNGGVVYAIDGSNTYGTDHMRPMKSTDGGASWKVVLNDATADNAYTIWADPNNNMHLMMSDYNTMYWSSVGAQSFGPVYHTNNNAAGLAVGGAFYDGNNIFFGTNEGLLVSNDGGNTFDTVSMGGIPKGEFIVSFAGAKTGNSIRLFCVTLGQVYAGITGADHSEYKSIYRCDWPTKTWTKVTNGIDASAEPFFVSMPRGDINTVYVAGGSTNSAPTVYKSTDGGANWNSVFRTGNNQNIYTGWSGQGGDRQWSYGEYALGFQCAPSDANTLVMTDLGFAHISTDGGATWHAAYIPASDLNPKSAPTPTGRSYHSVGLENTTNWNITWFDKNTLFGSYSDIQGTRSTDGGTTWGFGYTGHTDNTMYQVISFKDTTLFSGTIAYGATSSVHDMYQSTTLTDSRIDGGHGKVLFSTDKGMTWQLDHDFGHPVIWIEADPLNSHTVYACVVNSSSGGIYVSHDAAIGGSSTWTKLAAPPRTEGHPFVIHPLRNGNLLASYSGHRTNNFTASSGVFLSTDGGKTWLDRSDNAMKYWTMDVVVDPYDNTEQTWYAGVYSGWGGQANGLGGLYRTTDAGVTWKLMKSMQGVTSITFSPNNPDAMYVTSEVDGLWYCGNRHDIGYNLVQVSSYPFRQPMRVFYNPYDTTEIWVSSFGNGMRVGRTAPKVNPPEKVVLVSPANTATNVSTVVPLSWQAASGATSYTVEIATDATMNNVVQTQHTGLLSFTPDTLVAGMKYYWSVTASNSGGSGSQSDIWSFTTASKSLTIPTLISPPDNSANQDTTLMFVWSKIKNATGYRLQISQDPNLGSFSVDTAVTDTECIVHRLYTNTPYLWRVQALGDGGAKSAFGIPFSFTTKSDALVNEPKTDRSALTIAANPAHDELRVKVAMPDGLQTFTIYDMLGRSVASVTTSEQEVTIPLHGLSCGTYLLEVHSTTADERIRFVHQ